MSAFYDGMSVAEAEQVQGLTRLMLELRENRKKLLAQYAVDDEAGLLQKITAGEVAEHPAYEHYLGAKLLSDAGEKIREDLKNFLREASA